MSHASTDKPPAGRHSRGVRAFFLLGAALSSGVALLGTAMWALGGAGHGGGYNSKASAMIACVHVGLSLLGAMVTVLIARWFQATRIIRLLAGAYVFVTAIVYLELLAAFFYPREPTTKTPYESAPTVSWRLKSNFHGVYAGVPLETNALGFRSLPLSKVVDDRMVRVVCLGDSTTFGHTVEAHDAYPQQLARILRHRYPDRHWQVINTGVPGYCTFQETQQLKRCLANGFHPDLVVLLFCLNDVTEKYTALQQFGGTGLGFQKVADGAGNGLFQALVWLRQYSSLITAVTPTRAAAERRQAYTVRQLWTQPDAPHIQNAWAQAEKELKELLQLCDEEDIGLLIAVTPFRQQFTRARETTTPQRRLEKFARSHEVAFVDLLPGLQDKATQAHRSPESFYVDRPHLNAAGNRAMAEIIADYFRLPDETERPNSPKATSVNRWREASQNTRWRKVLEHIQLMRSG